MSEPYRLEGKRVWVAGHRGMVGAALVRRLRREGCEVVTVGREQADLRRQAETEGWIASCKPDLIFLAAAKVGGIVANASQPAEFLYDNLMIEANIIHSAYRTGVPKLVFLGSSCIYPKFAQQPIVEEALLEGALEPTNEAYAIAKIAGIKLCDAYRTQYGADFISAMPSNLYGPDDNFDLLGSHVLPALMRKCHEAKLDQADALLIWGSGEPRREFLHVDDCADAVVHLARTYSGRGHINVGSGQDISINDLAALMSEIVGYDGPIRHDRSKPDGTFRKLLDIGRIRALGWEPRIALQQGIRSVYDWYLARDPTERSARHA